MGLGFMEIIIIGVVSLVLLGPSRLPGLMRQAAKIYVQMRRTSNEFKSAFDHVVQEAEQDMLSAEKPLRQADKVLAASVSATVTDKLQNSLPSGSPTLSRPDRLFEWDVQKDPKENS